MTPDPVQTEVAAGRAPAWFPFFGLGVLLVVLFFPALFMGRVLSPNDAYLNYEPWASGIHVESQNPQIHDPPLAYYPMARMIVRDPSSFNWNPYIASGVPGWGSAASAVLTPLILVPALAPPSAFFGLVVLIKIALGFFFAYRWLREEEMNELGATAGALVIAGAGATAVLWLWQMTNATVLYPALLWAISRMVRGRSNSYLALTLLCVTLLLSGYPAAILYGLYLSVPYFAVRALQERRFPWRESLKCVLAAVTAFMLAAPALLPFIRFLGRTNYLAMREGIAQRISFPPGHLAGLINPFYAGSPMSRDWQGVGGLVRADNFVEATIYVSVIGLSLMAVALFTRTRQRVFWLLFLLVCLGAMFGTPLVGILEKLPGMSFSPLTRLKVLLPLPVGFLAGSGLMAITSRLGSRRRSRMGAFVITILAVEMAIFAGLFHPFVERDVAEVSSDPSIEYLVTRSEGRILPTFDWLMPNSAQIFGVHDVRSQWAAEAVYRKMIERIDPRTIRSGTVMTIDGLNGHLNDPVVDLLGVTHLVEPPHIDIIRWRIEDDTIRPQAVGSIDAGSHPKRLVVVEEGQTAVEVLIRPRSDPKGCRIQALSSIPETGEVIDSIVIQDRELALRDRIHLEVPGNFRQGQAMLVELSAPAGCVEVVTENDGTINIGRIHGPLRLDRVFDGARIFARHSPLPLYRATWRVERRELLQVLEESGIDFRTTTHLDEKRTFGFEQVPMAERSARFRILDRSSSRTVMEVTSTAGFLLTTSEKVDEDLTLTVDGDSTDPIVVNGLFAGTPIPAGRHRVEMKRRIGHDAWPASALAVFILIVTRVRVYGRSGRRATNMNW